MIDLRRLGRLLGKLVPFGILVLGIGTTLASAASGSWRYAAGTRTTGVADEGVHFELWWRSGDAVLRESVDGRVVAERRCTTGRYVGIDHLTGSEVVRDAVSRDDCMAWATGHAHDAFALSRAAGLMTNTEASERGRKVLVFGQPAADSPLTEVIADEASGLPLRLTTARGSTIRWDYSEIGTRGSAPPRSAASTAAYREEYSNLTLAAAADRLGVRSLPGRIGDLILEAAFDYRPSGSGDVTTYVIWRHSDGREVQVVRGVGTVAAEEVGVHDLGGQLAFKAQLGNAYIYILAPDHDALASARSVLGT